MVIYKVTNLINGKYYIGKDKNNISDYLGSGLLIKKAIILFGRHNFKKEILFKCSSIKEMNEKEREYVNESVVNDRNSYNLILGGEGGDTYSYRNAEERKRYHDNMSKSKSGENHHYYGKNRSLEEIANVSKGLKKYFKEIGCSNKAKLNLSIATTESWKNGRKSKIKISIDGVIYNSSREAEKILGINRNDILQKCRDDGYINYKIIN